MRHLFSSKSTPTPTSHTECPRLQWWFRIIFDIFFPDIPKVVAKSKPPVHCACGNGISCVPSAVSTLSWLFIYQQILLVGRKEHRWITSQCIRSVGHLSARATWGIRVKGSLFLCHLTVAHWDGQGRFCSKEKGTAFDSWILITCQAWYYSFISTNLLPECSICH